MRNLKSRNRPKDQVPAKSKNRQFGFTASGWGKGLSMARVESFSHGGRKYQIVVDTGSFGIRVETFVDGKAVSPAYTASCETAVDFTMSGWAT